MLEEFDRMYYNAWGLDTILDKGSEEYIAFSSKTGLPVKVFQIPELLDHVPLVQEYFTAFRELRSVYVVPCDNHLGDILGYVLRGIGEKGYYTVFHREKGEASFQPTFGWQDFRFYEKGKPIVLTEGIKDCLYLKKFYPYVISPLSCRLSDSLCEFISKLTDRVIIAFDNDTEKETNAGQAAAKSAEKRFGKFNVNVKNMVPGDDNKDFGEYFLKKELDFKVKMQLNMLL